MDSFNKTVSQLEQCTCQIKQPKPKMCIFPIIFPMFIPLFLTISLRMFLFHDQVVSYVSYADWLNERQGQENSTIEEIL